MDIKRNGELFAGLSGFTGVLMGALAAHKTQDAYAAELLQKASFYDLAHVPAILFLCGRPQKMAKFACALFALGILFFCGGLTFKALAGISFGALVPIGGTCLMLGWLAVAVMAAVK